MPAEGIKVVLFDLGNVLVNFDISPALRRFSGFNGKSPEWILKTLLDSGLPVSFEKGLISPEDFHRNLCSLLELRIGYESFVCIWNEIFFFGLQNRAVFHIASLLKKNYRLAVLSNTNILHYNHIKENFPVFGIFDELFLSFEIGDTKPSREVYLKTVRALDVLPENIFYTDDRKEFIKSSSLLGIKSFVFEGADKLLEDLSGLNII
ncbi:MAG: HAD family phosphatase [Candidatus Omnitrophica bacterium]|nr:HAD family phosphatase [Candidatus Omnitrophota bacterium]MDD5500891.1 HAD family phosphatase [Candidatus Omnitrophota bacterium]